MSKRHVARPGDTIETIAEAHGLAPDALWHHPDNAALRERRRDRNVLHAGDEIHVPDSRPGTVMVATGSTHVFKRNGVPSMYRLQLCANGEPRADVPWRIEVDDRTFRGRTDAEGIVEFYLHPVHRTAWLHVDGDPPRQLALGFLDPLETCAGVQQRLSNLGIECPRSGVYDDATRSALRAYQRRNGLAETGEADEPTCTLLASAHGRQRP